MTDSQRISTGSERSRKTSCSTCQSVRANAQADGAGRDTHLQHAPVARGALPGLELGGGILDEVLGLRAGGLQRLEEEFGRQRDPRTHCRGGCALGGGVREGGRGVWGGLLAVWWWWGEGGLSAGGGDRCERCAGAGRVVCLSGRGSGWGSREWGGGSRAAAGGRAQGFSHGCCRECPVPRPSCSWCL